MRKRKDVRGSRYLRVVINNRLNEWQGGRTHRLTLPNAWVKDMGIEDDNRLVLMAYDGDYIIIRLADPKEVLESVRDVEEEAWYKFMTEEEKDRFWENTK